MRTFTGLGTGDVDGDDRRHARLGSRRPQQTVVNLADRSDPAVKRAVKEAFDTSLRGAVAMGFARIRVDGIQVLKDVVVLATVATDEDDDGEAPDNTRD